VSGTPSESEESGAEDGENHDVVNKDEHKDEDDEDVGKEDVDDEDAGNEVDAEGTGTKNVDAEDLDTKAIDMDTDADTDNSVNMDNGVVSHPQSNLRSKWLNTTPP
jgi:hypothetical protein